jgi:glyoxylase-like metal-dependent hydrolase (beta-lactamase superfamily II)
MKTLKEFVAYLIISFSIALIFSSYKSPHYQGKDLESSVIKEITEDLYVINYRGANYTIYSCTDGLLVVDTGYPGAAAGIDSIIKAEFNKPIKYIVNTHLHFDHVGGNKILSADGAVIISHENTRKRMLKEWKLPEFPGGFKYRTIPPYTKESLPKICFSDSINIHFNDEIIKLIHMPEGHSDGDIIVYFQKANVIHTGDLFLSNAFPPFEGTIEGYLTGVEKIVSLCDETTIVIPGHGPISDNEGLIIYRNILDSGAVRINQLKSQGKTFEEVMQIAPLEGLLSRKSSIPEVVFTYCVFYGGLNNLTIEHND